MKNGKKRTARNLAAARNVKFLKACQVAQIADWYIWNLFQVAKVQFTQLFQITDHADAFITDLLTKGFVYGKGYIDSRTKDSWVL